MVIAVYRQLKHIATRNPEAAGMASYLIRNGFGTPDLERSWQLWRIAAGQQTGPEMSEILQREPGATLNMDFWRAPGA
jgi:hypothetical protein